MQAMVAAECQNAPCPLQMCCCQFHHATQQSLTWPAGAVASESLLCEQGECVLEATSAVCCWCSCPGCSRGSSKSGAGSSRTPGFDGLPVPHKKRGRREGAHHYAHCSIEKASLPRHDDVKEIYIYSRACAVQRRQASICKASAMGPASTSTPSPKGRQEMLKTMTGY